MGSQQRQKPGPHSRVSSGARNRDELSFFLHCIIEGLKIAKVRPVNYGLLAATHQNAEEPPVAFLKGLKEAMIKFTNLTPESVKGKAILRDKFLTWNHYCRLLIQYVTTETWKGRSKRQNAMEKFRPP